MTGVEVDMELDVPSARGEGDGINNPDNIVLQELDVPSARAEVVGINDPDNTVDFVTPPPRVTKNPILPIQKPVGEVGPGRRSKRMRTFSTKLDGRFQYDKKTKVLVGHPSPIEKESHVVVNPEDRFQNSLKKLSAVRSISLGGEASLSNKDVFDIIERRKHLSAKVMDALIRFSLHLLRTDDIDGQKLRVDLLDSKFVSLLFRQFSKFSKSPSPAEFKFPDDVITQFLGGGDKGRALLFSEADCLYVPFNFDRKHWVSLCIDLANSCIVVIDCNTHLRKDQEIIAELQPISIMLPYLIKQAGLSQSLTGPFTISRPMGVPQVQSAFDSGIMAVFLIHAHATGGLEECAEVIVEQLESEIKRLVSAIILAGAA
ncbi:uncharacterized protein LOC17887645 isoform X2 [Capsella rubella]|nr:uncharacterized protein LOC17887645 isoform X2 [Capsella rubella]